MTPAEQPEKYYTKYKGDFAGISYQKYLKTIARKNDFDKGVKELRDSINYLVSNVLDAN